MHLVVETTYANFTAVCFSTPSVITLQDHVPAQDLSEKNQAFIQ